MQLTKTKEKEILKVYDTWMTAYLNADVATYDRYFDDSYHFIGSTHNEEYLSRKDTTEFFRVTGEQLSGMLDLRNESKILEQFGDYVFLTHICDTWFKNDEDWSYYGRFRLSSVLHQTKEGWKFIYQHFSLPDAKSEEGETIGFEKVHAENEELREAIKRRTTELEAQKRELEIEGALGRIRAQATAMKTSIELLDIVVTMRNEFIKLGHEAHYFWHMMWLPNTYEKAMTSGDGTRIGFVMTLPRHIHGDIPLLSKWEKSKDATVVYTMNTEEAIDYVDKMVDLGDFQNIDPQAPSHDDIRHIGGLTFIMARTTHGEIGYSLPGIVENPPKDGLDILVRFTKAFDLAHQRFLDLQKAEKQARETQIELSLERIRSRVTAMQQSSDLFDIVVTMRNEFISLGHVADYFWHMKWTKDNYEMSMTAEDGSRLGMVITVPKFVHDNIPTLAKWEKSNKPTFTLALDADAAWDYIENMNTHGHYHQADPNAPTQEDIQNIGGITFVIARTTHGEIGFSLPGKVNNPPTASIEILVRFASVFDLAYKRFEDLKNAEAQARETEIELALEKVRSRTMAMQHSDELQEASFLLDEQVRGLGIETWGCAFNIYGEEESKEWFGNEKGELTTYTVPRTGIFKEYYNKGQEGATLLIKEFSGDDCVAHYEFMSTLPGIGDVLKQLKKTNKGFPTYQIDHVVFFKYGYLLFITRESVPEAHDIFKRFAKVFEQTYTRFLDLQKAEEQAREAKVEAALERIRSRSLAMTKSEQLGEVILEIHKKFRELDISMESRIAIVVILDSDSKDFNQYIASNDVGNFYISTPYCEHPILDDFYAAKEAGVEFFSKAYTEEEKNSYFKHFFDTSFTPYEIVGLEEQVQWVFNQKFYTHSQAFQKNSCIGMADYSGIPLNDFEIDTIKRFSKVFDQAYTRFLDLKKAEAQAREAQIEASLERVRSRAMAMHSTNELQDVIQTVHQELIKLEIGIHGGSFIAINHEIDKELQFWGSGGTAVTAKKFIMPYYDRPFYTDLFKGIKKGPGFFTESFSAKEKKEFFTFLFQHEPWSQLDKKEKEEVLSTPNGYVRSCCVSKHTSMVIVNHFGRDFSEDENLILKRFARVFEQTYTRFLDLQKAEEQAREAQIEAALERVRSRSMAMHQSEEIGEVAKVLFQQLKSLGGELWGSGFGFCEENSEEDNFWFVTETEVSPNARIPNTTDPAHKQMYEGWKDKQDLFSIAKGGKELADHYKYMLTLPDIKPIFQSILDNGIKFPTWQKWHAAYFKYGYLLVITTKDYEDEAIFKRFAKAFEQAYTRFLDLQKAEAQAREAQIVASLERVRAATMAMHQSKELSNVLSTLFEQYDILGITPSHAVLTLINKEKNTLTFRSTGKNGYKVYAEQEVDLNVYDSWLDTTEKWKKSKPNTVNVNEYPPEILPDVWEVYKDVLEAMPKKARPEIKDFPDGLFITEGYCQFGYIGFAHNRKPTEEEKDIVRRFATEFGSLYQRFLDLQKAEAQAREAQIEAALERVRSRSMAMHNSEEFPELIQLVFEQFRLLNFNIDSAQFDFSYQETDDFNLWTASPGQPYPSKQHIPYKNNAVFNALKEAKESGLDFITNVFTEYEKNEFFEHFFQYYPNVPEQRKQYVLSSPGMSRSVVLMDQILLGIQNYSAIPYTDSDNAILIRFAKAFKQTYIRFLDLQNAEAQAREAQIEVALEKIRSRTMAMQKGEELKDVVVLLYKELIALGVTNFTSCGYVEINEETERQLTYVTDQGGDSLGLFYLPMQGDKVFDERYAAWKKQEAVFHQTVGGKERRNHLEYAITTFNSQEAEEMVLTQFPDPTVFYCFNFSHGYLHIVGGSRLTTEEEALMARFTRVFEQTYARFLDLKKAEIQTREAQINLAVERVRAKALAMHKSEEIMEVVAKLKEEVMGLDIPAVVAASIFLEADDNYIRMWDLSALERSDKGYLAITDITFKLKKADPHLYIKRVWENNQNYFVETQDTKDLDRIIEFMYENNQLEIAKEVEDYTKSTNLQQLYHASKRLNYGKLCIDLLEPPPDEMEGILDKIGAAFDLAYQRFLDLQKAEAQTKESQIQLALERVRAKTMAMQHSDELREVVLEMYEQLQQLDFDAQACNIIIIDKDTHDQQYWVSGFSQELYPESYQVPNLNHPYIQQQIKAWKKGITYEVFEYKGAEKRKFDKLFFSETDFKKSPKEAQEMMRSLESVILSTAFTKSGSLQVLGPVPLNDEKAQILQRFAQVFDQTYTRFLDLQRAEAQAREAQIEMALEKVRSRTMAMQKSEELRDAAQVLFTEVQNLGIPSWSCGYNILSDDKKSAECYMSSEGTLQKPFTLYYEKEKSFIEQYEFFKSKKTFLIQEQKGKDLEEAYDYMKTIPKIGEIVVDLENAGLSLPTHQFNHLCKFSKGYLLFITYEDVPEAHEIFKRFTAVFEQTYIRFLDLQKAEEQARESQIEAALEKVRSRSLAMQKPDELQEVVAIVAEKLKELGVIFDAGGVILCTYFPDNKDVVHWIAVPDFSSSGRYYVPYFDNPIFNDAWDSKAKGDAFFSKEFSVEAKNEFFKHAFKNSDYRQMPEDYKQFVLAADSHHLSAAWSKNSAIIIPSLSGVVPSENDAQIMQRFAKVFEQAYIRFMDLQQAEIREKEAIKQASLDRVRGEIASMRTTKDLERITPLIWKELNTLGVPFFRCGVFIIREDEKMVHAYLSKPDGTSVAALHIPFSDTDNKLITPTIENWRLQQAYKETWNQDQFIEQTHLFLEKGQIENPDAYDISETPPEQLVLHLIPFKQGMVYVGNHEDLTEDQISLVESLSTAFSVAYSRYEDFKALETAKNSLELTINDLKSTQAQLIQAEKMASLGELTAGIAHEIQNPLNFVNNFSEVSEELIDEMNEELDNGDLEEAKAISKDLKNNLGKINHHGKRADAIVKGMLEHSRINKGEKKPTDINALLDEFVRLSYHGLRAKDKSFNADFKLNLDPNVPKVNVVSSDIGRVILNLVNNAFYACAERGRISLDSGIKTYNPEVIVSSKQTEQGIELSVKDNGGGIPDQVKDKIFQPFFTTKPTGKGTGLGLSLSYDIIKAHGGKLTMESSEGDGTLFSIQIPIQ